MVVAEALGEHEALQGRPLVEWAPAGSVLQRAFDRVGIDREQMLLWNIVACRPPNNKFEGMPYENAAAAHCRVHFDKVLAQNPQIRCILALGNTALKHLTGMTGKNRTVSSLRGYVLENTRGYSTPSGEHVFIVPTFHPSFIQRGAWNLHRIFIQDLVLALEVAAGRGRFQTRPEPPSGFRLKPTQEDLRELITRVREQPDALISYDIETDRSIVVDESEIFRLDRERKDDDDEDENEEEDAFDVAEALKGPIIQTQFSLGIGHAVSIPFTESTVLAIREVLRSPNPKIGHNCWRFDDPLLRAAGIRVEGRRTDTMWMWHHAQPDLPAHLQFVASQFGQEYPWKHLAASDLGFYGAVDVEVLHRIHEGLRKEMEEIRL